MSSTPTSRDHAPASGHPGTDPAPAAKRQGPAPSPFSPARILVAAIAFGLIVVGLSHFDVFAPFQGPRLPTPNSPGHPVTPGSSLPSAIPVDGDQPFLYSYPPYADPLPPQIPANSSCFSSSEGYICHQSVVQHWAQHAPHHVPPPPTNETFESSLIRDQCTLRQVHLSYRHGTRYATLGRALAIAKIIRWLQEHVPSVLKVGKWEWLGVYNNEMLDDPEELTIYGQQEMFQAGARARTLYSDFLARSVARSPNQIGMTMRAGGIPRVVMSMMNFTDGFYSSINHTRNLGPKPAILAISEEDGVNNTLHHSICPRFESDEQNKHSRRFQRAWGAKMFAPVIDRFNSELGVEVNWKQVDALFELCHFMSGVEFHKDLSALYQSCGIFEPSEWKLYDYYQNVAKYYRFGLGGGDLNPAQGLGYVHELLARITLAPVPHLNSVNATAAADPATFPTSPEHNFFVDGTHDNDQLTVFAALGMFRKPVPVDVFTEPEDVDGFSVSRLTHFGAGFAIEVYSCGDDDDDSDKPENRDDWLVTIRINEQDFPLRDCAEYVFEGGAAAGITPSACRVGKLRDMMMAKGDLGWSKLCDF